MINEHRKIIEDSLAAFEAAKKPIQDEYNAEIKQMMEDATSSVQEIKERYNLLREPLLQEFKDTCKEAYDYLKNIDDTYLYRGKDTLDVLKPYYGFDASFREVKCHAWKAGSRTDVLKWPSIIEDQTILDNLNKYAVIVEKADMELMSKVSTLNVEERAHISNAYLDKPSKTLAAAEQYSVRLRDIEQKHYDEVKDSWAYFTTLFEKHEETIKEKAVEIVGDDPYRMISNHKGVTILWGRASHFIPWEEITNETD